MSFTHQDIAAFGRAASLLRRISALKSGEAINTDFNALLDCLVPANPLDRQSARYIAEWMMARLPFKVESEFDQIRMVWIVRRQKDTAP